MHAVLLFFLAWIGWTAWQIWTFDVTSDQNADAAIVLGASTWNGKPSPVYVARIEHGIGLYRSGRVKKILFSGGTGKGEPVSLAESASAFAEAQGIPADAIILEPYSRITKENLYYSKQIAESAGLHTFLIVSDPLHMKRAMRMAREMQMTAWPSATPTTRFRSLGKRLWFLKRETYFYIQYVLVTRFFTPPAMIDELET